VCVFFFCILLHFWGVVLFILCFFFGCGVCGVFVWCGFFVILFFFFFDPRASASAPLDRLHLTGVGDGEPPSIQRIKM